MLQGKGGIGKTLVANLIIQYCQHTGRPVQGYDSDPVNATLAATPGLGAAIIQLVVDDQIAIGTADAFVETLLTTDVDTVIDNGAASFLPVSRYLVENEIAGLFDAAGRDLIVHTVICGGGSFIETLKGMEAIVKYFPETVRIVCWENEFFGPVRLGEVAFKDTPLYRESSSRVLGTVRLKAWNPASFGANLATMLERKQTFDEATAPDSGFNTVERSRLLMIQKDIFSQLAAVL